MKIKEKTNLSVNIGSLHLENPTILASGVLGLDRGTLYQAVKGGACAVTMKSLTLEPRKGHNNPILVEVEAGFLNAVGYANKGIEKGAEEFKLWDKETPIIGSIVGGGPEEFSRLAEKIQTVPIKALEIALSCPHTPGYGLMAGQGTSLATAAITKAVRKIIKVPLIVKVSPSVQALGEIVKAAEAEGADAINMGNTLGPGMKIDIERRSPILAFKFGGMSGPAIKPIMIRCVYDIYEAVKIPIIATGGITTGEDMIEAFMAGAMAVGVGTAIYYRGINVFQKICHEAENWMIEHKLKDIMSLRGTGHKI
jgi:dihydroorotate dehydrogenase (NAD+) catalytic subunit